MKLTLAQMRRIVTEHYRLQTEVCNADVKAEIAMIKRKIAGAGIDDDRLRDLALKLYII